MFTRRDRCLRGGPATTLKLRSLTRYHGYLVESSLDPKWCPTHLRGSENLSCKHVPFWSKGLSFLPLISAFHTEPSLRGCGNQTPFWQKKRFCNYLPCMHNPITPTGCVAVTAAQCHEQGEARVYFWNPRVRVSIQNPRGLG